MQRTHFENVSAGCEFLYAGAMSYRIGGWDGRAEVGAEVEAATGLAPLKQINLEELPVEARIFAKIHATKEVEVTFGPDFKPRELEVTASGDGVWEATGDGGQPPEGSAHGGTSPESGGGGSGSAVGCRPPYFSGRPS